jgi:hypothetical protein
MPRKQQPNPNKTGPRIYTETNEHVVSQMERGRRDYIEGRDTPPYGTPPANIAWARGRRLQRLAAAEPHLLKPWQTSFNGQYWWHMPGACDETRRLNFFFIRRGMPLMGFGENVVSTARKAMHAKARAAKAKEVAA